MDAQKKGPLGLLKNLFGLNITETKEANNKLSAEDKIQLGSAIARQQGIAEGECSFGFVEY